VIGGSYGIGGNFFREWSGCCPAGGSVVRRVVNSCTTQKGKRNDDITEDCGARCATVCGYQIASE
jgi:hypothetical protein